MAFQLTVLLSPWAGNARLHDYGNIVKQTIVTAIPMVATYCSISLVIIFDIRGVETPVVIVHDRRAGRRRRRSPGFAWRAASTYLDQVLLRDRMPLSVLFLNLDNAHTSDEENWKREFIVTCPWPPLDPSRWDCRRHSWSADKVCTSKS